MAGAYDLLVGELWPGAYGWLPLDSVGTPSGPATIDPPPGPDALACHVMCSGEVPLPDDVDMLTTSTGAPITDHMNSNVDNREQLSSQYKSPPKPPGWTGHSDTKRRDR